MQIQVTGEIGSTNRKFHLSGVTLIERGLYYGLDGHEDGSWRCIDNPSMAQRKGGGSYSLDLMKMVCIIALWDFAYMQIL